MKRGVCLVDGLHHGNRKFLPEGTRYSDQALANRMEYQRQYARKHRKEQWERNIKYKRQRPKPRFDQLRYHAKKRGIEVTITFQDYENLVTGKVCTYCSGDLPVYAGGLDRLNPAKGYELGNVVPCCHSCNMKKGHLESAGFEYPRTKELLMELLAKEIVGRDE